MGPDVESPAMPQVVVKHKPNWGTRKLYGSTLNHFGAFVDGAWRDRDWTWGRLDAAAHLVRMIVSDAPEAGIDDAAENDWVLAIQKAILGDAKKLDAWKSQVTQSFDGEGIDNQYVLNQMRMTKQGRASLTELFDEFLTTAAAAGRDGPGLAGAITENLRESLYLEEPYPRGLDPESRGQAGTGMVAASDQALDQRPLVSYVTARRWVGTSHT